MSCTGLQTCVRRLAKSKVTLAVADVTRAGLNEDALRICQCRGIAHGSVSTPSVNNCKRRDDFLLGWGHGLGSSSAATGGEDINRQDKTDWQTDPRTTNEQMREQREEV